MKRLLAYAIIVFWCLSAGVAAAYFAILIWRDDPAIIIAISFAVVLVGTLYWALKTIDSTS